jgi:peptidyl-prolyl cis-trans isomerase D
VKARYLYFDPETYIPEVSVSDEEIQYYYNENQEEFKTPKTVEARHILLKVDDNAEPETVEKTKNKALNVLNLAREGKDFAELAKQYSEGPTKDKGGYLGTFKKETMVKPFADKAFSMKAGEISEPVRTRFGWHIIKVENVNEASFLSLDEAKEKIEKKISAEEAKSLAYDEADAVSDISFEGDDLLQAAKEHNLKVLTTDFFTRKGPEKGIIDRNEFASAAFGLLDMEISDTQDFKDGYYILQVIDRIPAKIPEIEKVKDAVLADLINEKQNEKANEDANAFLSGLKSGRSMSEESKKYNLSSTTTGFFKRNGPIPEIGREVTISQAVFKLSSEKKLPEKAIRGRKGYYVIQFNDRKAPEDEAFSKEKEKTVQNLLLQKQSSAFNALLAQLKNTGEISIKEGFLE